VGCGGGAGGGVGRRKTRAGGGGTGFRFGFAGVGRAVIVFFGTSLRATFFGATTFRFGFAMAVFVALRAGALPAGERLVAGFNRVDFVAAFLREAAALPARRDDARGESFFVLFVTVLLTFRRSPIRGLSHPSSPKNEDEA